jgi:hypothetical protein
MMRSTKMDTNTIAKMAASDMVPPPFLHCGRHATANLATFRAL